MTNFDEEASPVARLVGPDGKRTVGWVYAWETSELSILWISGRDSVAFIDRKLCAERLMKAKGITPEDVIAYAAKLLGMPIPTAEDFATAEMTAMARSFYAESKKVRNDRIKDELGVELLYPDYRSGLKSLFAQEMSA